MSDLRSGLTNLLYRAKPDSFCGSAALTLWTSPSSLVEPVEVAGIDMVARLRYVRVEGVCEA